MAVSSSDIAAKYVVDDVSGANLPASRLNVILQRLDADVPLTVAQEAFLASSGYKALLGLALGDLDFTAFVAAARIEQQARIAAKAAAELIAREREAAERDREAARRLATDAENRALAAMLEHRRERHRIRERFEQPQIEREDYLRVMEILKSVAAGSPIEDDDLLWLAGAGKRYWTEALQQAHQANCAGHLVED